MPELDEATDALIDMSVGVTLALASVVKCLVEQGVISDSAMIDALRKRDASWRKKASAGQAWPLQTLLSMLDGKVEIAPPLEKRH